MTGKPFTHLPSATPDALSSYAVYTSAQRQEFAFNIANLKTVLAKINDDTKSVVTQSQLEGLQAERDRISQALDEQHSLLAPIRNVPDELLSEIFLLPVEEPPVTPKEEGEFLLAITAVCRRWRTLAITTKLLWCSMDFDDEFTPPVELVQTWLTRAGHTPLQLTMRWDHEGAEEKRKAVLEVLIEASSRWECIIMSAHLPQFAQLATITEPFPALQTLSLNCRGVLDMLPGQCLRIFEHAPALEEVDLWGNTMVYQCPVPLGQLYAYHLGASSVKGCLWALDQCANLFECTIGAFINPDEDEHYPPVSSTPRTLSHLGTWRICAEEQQSIFSTILDHITAPGLHRLELYMQSWMDSPPITAEPISMIPFLTRSSCQLRRLELQGLVLSGTELLDILQHLPQLVDLAIIEWRSSAITPMFTMELIQSLTKSDSGATAQTPVPQLQKLSFWGRMDVGDEIIMSFLRSRTEPAGIVRGTHDHAVAQLQDVNLMIWRGADDPGLGPDSKCQLSIWQEEGKNIKVETTEPPVGPV